MSKLLHSFKQNGMYILYNVHCMLSEDLLDSEYFGEIVFKLNRVGASFVIL